MDNVTLIGVDLAKRVFHLHGAAGDGSVVFRKKLSRVQFEYFLKCHPRCVVAMEACGSAHLWGRLIAGFGHEVRLVPPVYAKQYVKRHKNDTADAETIAEAASHAVDLINALIREQADGNTGKIIRQLSALDCVIIDELGYIPFPKSGGALLSHLISKLLSYDFLWLLRQKGATVRHTIYGG